MTSSYKISATLVSSFFSSPEFTNEGIEEKRQGQETGRGLYFNLYYL